MPQAATTDAPCHSYLYAIACFLEAQHERKHFHHFDVSVMLETALEAPIYMHATIDADARRALDHFLLPSAKRSASSIYLRAEINWEAVQAYATDLDMRPPHDDAEEATGTPVIFHQWSLATQSWTSSKGLAHVERTLTPCGVDVANIETDDALFYDVPKGERPHWGSYYTVA